MICVSQSTFNARLHFLRKAIFCVATIQLSEYNNFLIAATIEQQRLYVSIDISNHKYIYLHMKKKTTIEASFRLLLPGLGF